MVAPSKRRSQKSTPAWHAGFLNMLPVIRDYARGAFGHFKAELRQDLIQEVIANAMVAYVRLFEQGKVALAFPTVLANFAIRQVRDHRRVGNRLNVKDALSPYCQKHKGVVVQRLDVFDEEEKTWKEAVVEDTRSAPVSDIVAFRCDFSDWLKSLRRRDRRIAESLAIGNRTGDVAKRFNVSAGRVSQLRRELAASWRAFVGDKPAPEAA